MVSTPPESSESESVHKIVRLIAKVKPLLIKIATESKALVLRLVDLAKREPVMLRGVLPVILALVFTDLTKDEINSWTTIIVSALVLIGGLSARGKVRPVRVKEQQEDLAGSVKAIATEVAKLRGEKKVTTDLGSEIEFAELKAQAKAEGGVNVRKGQLVRAKAGLPEHSDFALFAATNSFRLGTNPRQPYKDTDRWELVKLLKVDPRGQEVPSWDEVVARMRAEERDQPHARRR